MVDVLCIHGQHQYMPITVPCGLSERPSELLSMAYDEVQKFTHVELFDEVCSPG